LVYEFGVFVDDDEWAEGATAEAGRMDSLDLDLVLLWRVTRDTTTDDE
jgi:hypothetical protein